MMDKESLKEHHKIIIIGCSGSGKSWLAKKIAEITGYPLIHLDNEYWLPNWTKPPKDEWIAKQKELIKAERWIIEGNYNSTMELRFAAADLVIFLDINKILCIISAAKRTGKKRSDLPDYLEEPRVFNKEFLEFCKYIWQYPKQGKLTVMNLHNKYSETKFIHIKKRKDVNELYK